MRWGVALGEAPGDRVGVALGLGEAPVDRVEVGVGLGEGGGMGALEAVRRAVTPTAVAGAA